MRTTRERYGCFHAGDSAQGLRRSAVLPGGVLAPIAPVPILPKSKRICTPSHFVTRRTRAA